MISIFPAAETIIMVQIQRQHHFIFIIIKQLIIDPDGS